jgi:hypothetical protein
MGLIMGPNQSRLGSLLRGGFTRHFTCCAELRHFDDNSKYIAFNQLVPSR